MQLRAFLGFFRGIGTLARPWHAWIALLTLVNGVAPLIFIGSVEGRVVLISFLIAFAIELAMFVRLGFVRLLGAVHLAVWIPMLIWLWPRAALAGTGSLYGRWLAAVVLVDLLSLLIDATDVVRYAFGDREPTLTLEEIP
jgi:hypothetical protein